MMLPPKGDPSRPSQLAARLMQVIGILMVGGSLIGAVVAFLLKRGDTRFQIGAAMAIVSIAYAVPGVLYFLCGSYLRQRYEAPIVIGLVMGSVHLLMAIIGGLWLIAGAFTGAGLPWHWAILSILLAGGIVGAFSVLVLSLARSFHGVRHARRHQRGFEPLNVHTTPPVSAEAPPTPLPAPPARALVDWEE